MSSVPFGGLSIENLLHVWWGKVEAGLTESLRPEFFYIHPAAEEFPGKDAI
jgi:hypothetical protein